MLVKDTGGEVAHGDFTYSSVVGMMLYLSGHSRPDIAYAVYFAAYYMFCQRHFYEGTKKAWEISKIYRFERTY